MNMLKDVGVTTQWTWERTMRETIVNPFYKVLKTLAERKTAFEAYVQELLETEATTRKTSLDKARKGWMSAMERLGGGDPERGVKIWWSWDKGAEELEKRMSPPEVWSSVRNDEERRTLFHEYIAQMKLREVGRLQTLRVENLAKLANIFQALSLDLAGPLRWRDVHSTILSTQAWQSDPDLQRIAQVDILAVYEEELNKAEREQGDERRRVGEEKRRRARKAREAFVVGSTFFRYDLWRTTLMKNCSTVGTSERAQDCRSYHTSDHVEITLSSGGIFSSLRQFARSTWLFTYRSILGCCR